MLQENKNIWCPFLRAKSVFLNTSGFLFYKSPSILQKITIIVLCRVQILQIIKSSTINKQLLHKKNRINFNKSLRGKLSWLIKSWELKPNRLLFWIKDSLLLKFTCKNPYSNWCQVTCLESFFSPKSMLYIIIILPQYNEG